ncbi:MAG: DUF192 domain-containing protein [Candidatus Kerfeldbacteria bacterium]
MRKGFLLFVFIAIFVLAALIGFSGIDLRTEIKQLFNRNTQPQSSTATVIFPTVTVRAEVARTPEEQSRGLSGRASLADGTGMLFVYDTPGIHQFWMNGMKFPLDFIWINNGIVIGFTEKVPVPSGTSPILKPPSPVTHVLEVPSGFVLTHRIITGANVTLTFDEKTGG